MTTIRTREKLIEVALPLATLSAASYRPVVIARAQAVEDQRRRPTTIRLRDDWR